MPTFGAPLAMLPLPPSAGAAVRRANDLDDGALRRVPADPVTVAIMAGLHRNSVAPPA